MLPQSIVDMDALSAMSPTTTPFSSCDECYEDAPGVLRSTIPPLSWASMGNNLRVSHPITHASAVGAASPTWVHDLPASEALPSLRRGLWEQSVVAGCRRLSEAIASDLACSVHYMSPTESLSPSCSSSASDVDSETSFAGVQRESPATSETSRSWSGNAVPFALSDRQPPSPCFSPEEMPSTLNRIHVRSDARSAHACSR